MVETRAFKCDACKKPVPYEVVEEYRKYTVRVREIGGGEDWAQHRLRTSSVCCRCGAEYKLIKLDWGGDVVRERIR